jgi:hypothetical protein
MFLSNKECVQGPLLYHSSKGNALSAGTVSSDRGARSFLSHLVSDPHAQNTFRAWLSVWLRIPRLADGAIESLNQDSDIVLRIIYGAVALDQKLSSSNVECVRNSAEIANLGVWHLYLKPRALAKDGLSSRSAWPRSRTGQPLLRLGFLALCLYGLK